MTNRKHNNKSKKRNNVVKGADWERIQRFLQECGLVVDYLHWRVVCKRRGAQPEPSPIFAMTADADGELTEELVIGHLEAIARQARAGFVDGDDFPVFGSLEN